MARDSKPERQKNLRCEVHHIRILYNRVHFLSKLVTSTNESLLELKTLLERNLLHLNEDKTQFVVFHRNHRAYPVYNTVYLGDW